jgi:hypothetical protein
MLAGHKRYAHIAALRGDEVLPARREPNRPRGRGAAVFATIEEAGAVWLRHHLDIALSRFWLRLDSRRSYDKAVTYRALTSSIAIAATLRSPRGWIRDSCGNTWRGIRRRLNLGVLSIGANSTNKSPVINAKRGATQSCPPPSPAIILSITPQAHASTV